MPIYSSGSTLYSTANPPPDASNPLSLTAGSPTFTEVDGDFTSATTYTGATYYAWSDAKLTLRGTVSADYVAGSTYPTTLSGASQSLYPHTWNCQPYYCVEFMMDGIGFEFGALSRSTAQTYRLLVDGRRVQNQAVTFSPTHSTSDQHDHRIRIVFPDARPRRITLEFSYMAFLGVWVQGSLWKVPTYRDRTMILGDSISGGSDQNAGGGIGTWIYRAALTLGWDDPWNQSMGGTGYISVGTGTTFQNRATTDIINYNPTRIIIFGGYNDNTGNQATISTAASTLYQTLKAGAPAAEIIVIGCWSNSGSPGSAIINTDETLRVAAAGAGLSFISPVTGKVYNQRGTLVSDQSAWITSANAGTYLTGDGVHPNDNGHDYLAGRITNALKSLYSSISSIAPWAGGLHAALDDGAPSGDKELNYLSGTGTLATMTPTALTVSVARCWSYNCQFPVVVNRLRWWGIGATTSHRFAVYRTIDNVQVIGPISLTTTADAWNSASVAAVTLAPNTPYICAISTTTTGTTAGLRTSATPLLWPPLQASTPGGLALAIGDHRFWFGQFAVSSGVLPSTLPTLVRGSGWTAGLPLFFFDSNSAA